jgi:twitching motility protein PilT
MSESGSRGLRMADLLKSMVARGASDIHLQAGAPPHMRLDGSLVPYEGSRRSRPSKPSRSRPP